MTKLERRKHPPQLETSFAVYERGRARNVILELHPHYFRVRLKGLRGSFAGSYAAMYHGTVKGAVEDERRSQNDQKRGAA